MQRLLTALVATPVLLSAVFLLPASWFFVLTLLVVEWAVLEYVGLVRPAAPEAPLAALPVLVPLAALGMMLGTASPRPATTAELWPLAAGLVLTVGVGSVVLLGRTPVAQALPALGALGFGLPYFSLAAVGLARLQQLDPWLLFLGFAIVFLGDTGAYYAGSRLGRHKMAPRVSPNKSWEGAAAGLAVSLAAAAVWSWLRLGAVLPELLAVALATAVTAQLGDLVESMLKRGSGVKDSGRMLPGHGGILDRADATFFAMPVLLLGVWILGPETLVP